MSEDEVSARLEHGTWSRSTLRTGSHFAWKHTSLMDEILRTNSGGLASEGDSSLGLELPELPRACWSPGLSRLLGVTYDEWLAELLAHFPMKREVAERMAKLLSTGP